MSAAQPTPSDSRAPAGSGAPVDSNWWYVVAGSVVVTLGSAVLAFVVFASVLLGGFAVGAGPGPGPGPAGPGPLFGVPFGGLFVLVALLALAGFVVGVLTPVALYFDAEAVAGADLDWAPDPTLFGLLGAAGLFVQGLQPAVALYYLYKRHQHVGVP